MGSNDNTISAATQPDVAVKHFFTPGQLASLPALGDLEDRNLLDCTVHAKLFGKGGLAGWIWYVIELDPESGIAFGYVDGIEAEFGDFDLTELYDLDDTFNGLNLHEVVVRDDTFTPAPLRSIIGVEQEQPS